MNRKYLIAIDGESHEVELINRGANSITFSIGGKTHSVTISAAQDYSITSPAASAAAPAISAVAARTTAPAGSVCAPMPGIVTKVLCSAGQKIARGTPLLVIEAMKMENSINAPSDGTVSMVSIKAGEEVKKGQSLVTLA